MHIIGRRIDERLKGAKSIDERERDGITKEVSAIVFLIYDALKTEHLEKQKKGNWAVRKKGIEAIVDKQGNKKFLLTGFALHEKEAEATEAICSVIEQYSTTPAFLGVYEQVGAVLASKIIVTPAIKKSMTQGNIERVLLQRLAKGKC